MSAYRSLSDFAKNAPDEYADSFGPDNQQPTESELARMLAERPSDVTAALASLDTLATALDALADGHAGMSHDATSPRGTYARGRADGLRFAAEELRRALTELKRCPSGLGPPGTR